ncbi:hypothetical protein N9Y42_07980, partial [Mariniblastus sp.]|nr:hypothetical protein [Mariniblastus sp.]
MQSLTHLKTFASSLAFCLAISWIGQASLIAQDFAITIEGPDETVSWAFHKSGRIFAAVKFTATVIEYDTQGSEVRKFAVEPEPTKMLIKGDHLVVACQASSSFSVINLNTNQV